MYIHKILHFALFRITILILTVDAEYYEGPIWGMFAPKVVPIVTKCSSKAGNACLLLPTKKECKQRLAVERKPCEPPAWWYLYCKMIIAPRPTIKTTTKTINPFYKKMLEEVRNYKKKKENSFYFYPTGKRNEYDLYHNALK